MRSPTVTPKLQRLAAQAAHDPDRVFTTLAHLIDTDFLREAYQQTSKSSAAGIAGVTAQQYAEHLDENLRDLHERYGHIQEVIVQNFRTKPRIPMRDAPEPSVDDLLRTLAVARLVLGPDMNIQAPPNLSPAVYPRLLAAGLNDWGGISPLTPDHINPEKPWPLIPELRRATEGQGFVLRERLAIYPEFATRAEFLDERLRARVGTLIDERGLVKEAHERWRRW